MTKIKALLVDVGNNSVKWRLSNSVDMVKKRYPGDVTEDFFIDIWRELEKPEKVFVTCVAKSQVWQALEKSCMQLWNVKVKRVFSMQEGFGLINAYAQPADLGSDRWCAMIGALHDAGTDVVVIDCGSAITIDIVEKTGSHRGGYILPGIEMMKQDLGINTAQVNVSITSDEKLSLEPGHTTTGCVNAGVHLAAVKSIESVLNQQKKNYQDMLCYLTGGDAEVIADLLSMKCVMIPDLVLRGLAYVNEHSDKVVQE